MDFEALLSPLNEEHRSLVRATERKIYKLNNALTAVHFNNSCIITYSLFACLTVCMYLIYVHLPHYIVQYSLTTFDTQLIAINTPYASPSQHITSPLNLSSATPHLTQSLSPPHRQS